MTQASTDMVISFYRVRRALGWIGLVLPFALILGGLRLEGQLRDSLSAYFFSDLRELFVGALCAIGVFLISYRGYRRLPGEAFSDRVLSNIAGLAALCVALFPVTQDCAPAATACPEILTLTQRVISPTMAGTVHLAAAVVFFLCLAAFCLVQFPKTDAPHRPVIYRFCGIAILIDLAAIAGAMAVSRWGGAETAALIAQNNLVFWGEAFAVWLFALAWLTKGCADLAALSLVKALVR